MGAALDANASAGYILRHSDSRLKRQRCIHLDFFQYDIRPNLQRVANYGLDDLRFAQPVNYGDTLKVRLTCKQKTLREDSGYGEVRWDTEVTNQDDEIVASYDVLTMVATNEEWAKVSA